MTNKHILAISGSLLFFSLIGSLSGCNYETEERIDKTSTILPNGATIEVEKTNKERTAIGIISKHNYGTSHSFSYQLSINQDDITWNGGSGEPKNILFCRDTIYLHYFKEKSIRVEYTDSVDNSTKVDYHFETREVFQKHIDERYFFKLLGDAFWVDVLPEEYATRKEFCEEYIIPNDGELSLDPINQ